MLLAGADANSLAIGCGILNRTQLTTNPNSRLQPMITPIPAITLATNSMRRRLLLAAVGLTAVVCFIFMFVASQLASDLIESIEHEITGKQLSQIISQLKQISTGDDDSSAILDKLRSNPQLLKLDEDVVGLQIGFKARQVQLRPYLLIELNKKLSAGDDQSQSVSGMTEAHLSWFFWQYSYDPSSDFSILLVRRAPAIDRALNTLIDRLSITALLTLLLVCCAAFIISSQVAKRIKENNRKLLHMAVHDPLTGLPNRNYLVQAAQAYISAANQQSELDKTKVAALLLVDLDKFKDVNDAMGHAAGDELLISIANRLKSIVSELVKVVRYGGDEFVLWAEEMDKSAAAQLAKKIVAACQEPIMVNDRHFEIGASIGIACYPEDGEAVDELFKHADIAMFRAKRLRLGFQTYQSEQNTRSSLRVDLRGQLNSALQQQQFVLHYQPKVQLSNGNIVGLEALVRWHHPQQGLLSPAMFIDMVEQSSIVHEFTRTMLKQAIAQCRLWLDDNIRICVAVNISPYNLIDPKLVEFIEQQLNAYGVPAELLEVELVESATTINMQTTLKVFAQLRQIGVRLSIDDFGTGMSSLAYIKQLDVDYIKIDRSFIANITSDHRDEAVIKSLLVLCQNLHKKVVAEGVESAEQAQKLIELGCDLAQGRYFGQAMQAEQTTALLKETKSGSLIVGLSL